MSIAEADVQGSLRSLIDPNTGRDFASAKVVRKLQIDGANVLVDLQLSARLRRCQAWAKST
jgi:ATP-binding protein involved in chromosome partitioning